MRKEKRESQAGCPIGVMADISFSLLKTTN